MAELDVEKAVLNYRNRFLREIIFDLVVRFGKDEIMRILSDIKIEDERNKPMSDIEVAFLKAWRGEDYIIGEKLPEYIELPKDEFSRILSEANKQLENYLIDQRNIIEQFHKLLGVYTSTTALAKIAVLMREEEELTAPVFDFVRSIIQGKFHGHGFEHSEEPCNCNELAAADFLQKFQNMTQHT